MLCLCLNCGLLDVQIAEAYIFLGMNLRLKLFCWQAQQTQWVRLKFSVKASPDTWASNLATLFCIVSYTQKERGRSLQADIWHLPTAAHSHSYFHSIYKSLCTKWVTWIRQLFGPAAVLEIEPQLFSNPRLCSCNVPSVLLCLLCLQLFKALVSSF